MRPLELTLQGFRSYRCETTIELDGRGLFGIVGPTGAGKSSILDALIYALYGRTPQIGKDTKKLITSGTDQARVRLIFEVGGVAWDVSRIIRTQGASAVVLRRHGDTAPDTSGERAVNERIVDIVGLDYDAFCSSVTLPQGEFDRFLKATPSERSKILKRIFRYERVDAMREGAKRRLAGIDLDLRAVQAEDAALPADPHALLATLEGQRAEREGRIIALREAAEEFAEAQGVVAAAAEQLADVDRQEGAVRRTLAKIPLPALLEALGAEEEQAARRLAEAEDRQAAAVASAAALAQHAADVAATWGGEPLAAAKEHAARHVRVSAEAQRQRGALSRSTQERDSVQVALQEAGAAVLAAEGAAQGAAASLDAARQAHAAHFLRSGLRPGEPCPVCDQAVATIPASVALPVVEAAQRAAEQAQKAARAALEHRNRLDREAAAIGSRLETAIQEVARAEAELTALEAALAAILGAGAAVAEEIARREGLVAAAQAEAAAATLAAEAAARESAGAKAMADRVALKRRQVAGELIGVAHLLELEPPDTEDDVGALAGVAKRAGDAGAVALAELASRKADILAQEAGSREVLARLVGELGLAPQERIEDAVQSAARQLGALEARIGGVLADIAKRLELQAKQVEIQVRRDLYQRLASDLTDAKFIQYLLDAERHFLANLGSEKLFQLTGRYRFDDEGAFHLLDTANDVVRSPDTLSGGETFLASLSLALALAEAVSQGGSRLDCFFLDEGFGSLDAASLDLAMEGVASLAVPGRVIGVISHVAGVQAFLDDLIVLDKAADGTTIVVQHEGPIGYATGGI